jgi:aminoglycoside phosphotransferase family enzyme/predicted kinase
MIVDPPPHDDPGTFTGAGVRPGGPGPHTATMISASPAVAETHVSVLFFVGDRVYKLKKPIVLPFIDLRRRADREVNCHREVELNRRLAPDVYLGVVDLVGDDGTVCDHLVAMARMPADRRLSHLVTSGADVGGAIRDLAVLIAEFHRQAERSEAVDAAVGRSAVTANWEDNLAVLHSDGADIVDPVVVERVGFLAHRYLEGRATLFDERIAHGCAVDGHGDLLADDIYLLDDGPRVLDCLEFSDHLRAVDVLDDIAFLAMDFERLGAPDAAAQLLNDYVEASHQAQPHSLAHHYVAYRAGVRAKVACVRARQGDAASASLARQFLDIAHRHLERARVRLVMVGGLPGSGKSTIAAGLSARTNWPVLGSDATRKHLAGVDAETSMAADYGTGIYTPEWSDATYRVLLAEAETLLERGQSVIVDASWIDISHRNDAISLAAATASDVVPLVCRAPSAVTDARLDQRGTDSISDADRRIAQELAAHQHPWPDAIPIDTSVELAESISMALGALGAH